jgi:hypothetical protein
MVTRGIIARWVKEDGDGRPSSRTPGGALDSWTDTLHPVRVVPQHSLTVAGAAPIGDASLNGRLPEFGDRTRPGCTTIGAACKRSW